jgi:hypothetical protein
MARFAKYKVFDGGMVAGSIYSIFKVWAAAVLDILEK